MVVGPKVKDRIEWPPLLPPGNRGQVQGFLLFLADQPARVDEIGDLPGGLASREGLGRCV